MKTSEQINEIAGALAKAQAAFPKLLKDQTATIESAKGGYKYKYSDLGALFEAIRHPLADNGLALLQPIVINDGHHELVTLLVHSSGQFFESRMRLADYDRPQEFGSEITYYRRYSAGAIVGIASEVDDDGAAAQGGQRKLPGYYHRPPEKATAPAASIGDPTRKSPPVTDAEVDEAFGPRGQEKSPPAPLQPRTAAIETRTLTREVRQQQESLLKDIDHLAGELDMSDTDVQTVWGTYCGTATRRNVACQALLELRSYLSLRLDKAKAS